MVSGLPETMVECDHKSSIWYKIGRVIHWKVCVELLHGVKEPFVIILKVADEGAGQVMLSFLLQVFICRRLTCSINGLPHGSFSQLLEDVRIGPIL